ncbi:LCP family protein [Selenomonas sp. KH1T6]|uniref:LCP family protein n=1 Tax=Selenomonas sp. KH1T6 TaxID=3158784 RepID=UPI0008A7FBF2|nr:transcriptional attenuator, LytR family [Selenomonas ruminantium]
MAASNSSIPPRKNKHKKSIWPWVLAAFVFLGAALAGAYFASSSLEDKPTVAKEKKEELLTAKDKSTIMIMGVDERADDVGRSDTLMIATIDPKLDQAALLSIPRDTRVKIKGHGYDKINAAYAYGGERLTQDTVEEFLGVNMDHYIIVNVKAFQRIIDALGGVDIDVEKRMYYEDPWDDDGGLLIDLRPGLQHMDGKTAVTYVRYRDEEGDIGRIKRQQAFMKACMEKVTSPAIIPKLPSVIAEVFESVKTDLSVRQLLEFAGSLNKAKGNGLKTEMVPGRPLYIEGISYWIPKVSELRTALVDTLGITMNASMKSRIERAEAEYESSIPSTATEVPESDTSIGRASSIKHSSSSSDREERSTSSSRRETVKADRDDEEEEIPERNRALRERESRAEEAPRQSVQEEAPTRDTNTSDAPAPGRSSAGKTR